MKVLVTGGAGRLGSELIITLLTKEYEVKAFDVPNADFSRLTNKKHVEILKGDIQKSDDVKEAIEHVDGIFHLAALMPPKSEASKEITLQVNVKGTENLLEAILESGMQISIIFSSSVMVYGISAHEKPPIKEDHALSATDTYSESKIRCEDLIRRSGVPYTMLRISGIYGVELMELPEIILFKKDQRVNFIDRRDVVQALLSAYEKEKTRNKVLNIAGDRTWQMRGEEFIQKVYGAFGVEVEAEYSDVYTSFDWYDTSYSQSTLRYQNIGFGNFIKELEELARRLF